MTALLLKRNYSLLWFSQLISLVGSWALRAALPFHVFQVTGSILATGAMFAIEVIPAIVFGSIAGVFVDRWDRRWTMIGANVFRGLLLMALLAFRSAEQVWVVYVVAFLESGASLFFKPANNALLPSLVDDDKLVLANSLDALGENAARVIGPALGGVLLVASGLFAVALIDVASYFVGAVLLFFIQVPRNASRPAGAGGAGQSAAAEWLAFWREWLGGLRLVRENRALSHAFVAVGPAVIGDSIMGALLVVFVQDVLGAGAQQFGWVLTARGVGGIVGGFVVARIGPSLRAKNLMAFGMAGAGGLLIILLLFPSLPVAVATAILIGFPVMALGIGGQTWLQVYSDDRMRGRVFGSFETYSSFMSLLGIGFAALSGDSLGVMTNLYVAATLFISGGLMAYLLLRSRFLASQGIVPRQAP